MEEMGGDVGTYVTCSVLCHCFVDPGPGPRTFLRLLIPVQNIARVRSLSSSPFRYTSLHLHAASASYPVPQSQWPILRYTDLDYLSHSTQALAYHQPLH